MMSLYEKYRPTCWADVLGQPKAIRELQTLLKRNVLRGGAVLLSGKSGTGKTTLARIVANELADPEFVQEMDAKLMEPKALADIEWDSSYVPWGEKRTRVYIVNECHGLSKGVVTQFLTTLERIPGHVCWMFTTTRDGVANFDDMVQGLAFLSRTYQIELTTQGLAKVFAARAREIAVLESLDGKPENAYIELANECKANFRMMLQSIEKGEIANA